MVHEKMLHSKRSPECRNESKIIDIIMYSNSLLANKFSNIVLGINENDSCFRYKQHSLLVLWATPSCLASPRTSAY